MLVMWRDCYLPENKRGGQGNDAGHIEFTNDHFKAGNPDTRGLVVLYGYFSVAALQVAVVCWVIVTFGDDV
jgi:hypothetical protein